MERNKRWHIWLIIGVAFLTVYNILPSVFYYSQPLQSPISEKRAIQIGTQALKRVNQLENETVKWLYSYGRLLNTKIDSVELSKESPADVFVHFRSERDAKIYQQYLKNAGQAIPFYPSQLISGQLDNKKTLTIHRRIPIHFDVKKAKQYFDYSVISQKGSITPRYQTLVKEQVQQLIDSITGTSEPASLLETLSNNTSPHVRNELLSIISQKLKEFHVIHQADPAVGRKLFASFTHGEFVNAPLAIQQLEKALQVRIDELKAMRFQDESKSDHKGSFYKQQEEHYLDTLAIVRTNRTLLANGHRPLSSNDTRTLIEQSLSNPLVTSNQAIELEGYSLFFSNCTVHWGTKQITLTPSLALQEVLAKEKESLAGHYLEQLLFNEVAKLSKILPKPFTTQEHIFATQLNELEDAKSFIALDLTLIAKEIAQGTKQTISKAWNPQHLDLKSASYPVHLYQDHLKLSRMNQRYGLVVYCPLINGKTHREWKKDSLYVLAKGLRSLSSRYASNPDQAVSQSFINDARALEETMSKMGFIAYPATQLINDPSYSNDIVFELQNFIKPVLMATREAFTVDGSGKYAVLEFSDLKQRIATDNAIATAQQEELLKWRDEYQSTQVDSQKQVRFEVPAPTRNPLVSNLMISIQKYFRGDDSKVLKWGLDLYGGKTVHLELRDKNNNVISNEADIQQGINELYSRVNKMGVSEVAIRQEGSQITLDFPGSQNLSAKELVKASSMSFHIVNEKFSASNPELKGAVTQFLQEIWNRAVVMNRTDIDSLKQLAWEQLYGFNSSSSTPNPRSEAAKTLIENGLKFASPNSQVSGDVNSQDTTIALMSGQSLSDWNYQTNPLIFVFNNYALQGSNLTNIRAGFDSKEGNFLSFEVKNRQVADQSSTYPQKTLYSWTSKYSKDAVSGSELGKLSQNRGWRMAVILNKRIVSMPTLNASLRDSARISGQFTQREVTKLEADLKAGSLTFTPHILSEKNVSPDLGSQERWQGILAATIAVMLVIASMVIYYRFAGVVASFAVLLNLLIIWATLQNIQAAVTLAGIAGIILTVGMAVDANVLVFERIREEYAKSDKISYAIHAGYKRAFSAIVDSNITTIIAAFILLQFDSGPIKGLAVTLMIGIISSMFTALFVTRAFFRWWYKEQSRSPLKMMNWVKASRINFLKYTKYAFALGATVIIAGSFMIGQERKSILGMDFTGGYALTVELQHKPIKQNSSYRYLVEEALKGQGLTPQEYQVRELSPENIVRIFLPKSLKAFRDKDNSTSSEQKVSWILDALSKKGLKPAQINANSSSYSWTDVSGQVSSRMSSQAAIGLAIALLCILLYITIRFEFTYAVSATIGLAFDVLISIAAIGLLHASGVPIQIDLNTVAALMTIVGYSLNDTIIVFDRVREEQRLHPSMSLRELINKSLNVTLSRTLLTSTTTLLALIALVIFGGSAVYGFSVVMTVGVIVGTLSTYYVASGFLVLLSSREKKTANTAAPLTS